jgi:hypothetical protein
MSPHGTVSAVPQAPSIAARVGLEPAAETVGGKAITEGVGKGVAKTKLPLMEAYRDVFRPGGLGRLWEDPWVRYPAMISGAMEAPKVLRGEEDPLTAAFNVLAPIPAFRAGVLPGMAASFAAPAISSRFLGGAQQAPVPQAPQAPVNVNVMSSSPEAQMPMMPPPMPSMLPGVRTV